MTDNLARLNAWYRACDRAREMGHPELVAPAVRRAQIAGWRTLDQHTADLDAALDALIAERSAIGSEHVAAS